MKRGGVLLFRLDLVAVEIRYSVGDDEGEVRSPVEELVNEKCDDGLQLVLGEEGEKRAPGGLDDWNA